MASIDKNKKAPNRSVFLFRFLEPASKQEVVHDSNNTAALEDNEIEEVVTKLLTKMFSEVKLFFYYKKK